MKVKFVVFCFAAVSLTSACSKPSGFDPDLAAAVCASKAGAQNVKIKRSLPARGSTGVVQFDDFVFETPITASQRAKARACYNARLNAANA